MPIKDRIREFRRIPASELLPNPKNWRTHPDSQLKALRGVLSEIGWADAVLGRETPEGVMLIDGHARRDLNPETMVPVLVLDVTEEEADKLLAVLDPLAAMAGADADKLEALLAEVSTESQALEEMLSNLAKRNGLYEAGEIAEDEVPVSPAEAITKPGDFWILGNHRLLCGDSGKPQDVDRLLDGATIQLVNTDPPYNVNVEPRSNNAIAAGLSSFGNASSRNVVLRPKDRPLVNDFVSKEAFDEMLLAWFGNIARVLEPGRAFYIWGGYSNCGNYPPVLKTCELYFSQAIIWVKEHPVMTRKDFMGNHEWCFYGWREGAAHQWLGPNNAVDVWDVKKINPQSMIHLTEKPVELAARAMRYSSRPGENVLDLFGGSGSTLIAAEQTQRRAYLMELDPLYCDVIIERWEKFTGQKAELGT